MSRRKNRSELVMIYWRDIPAQVTAQVGATREQALLPESFQKAIDRAATNAGLTTTDDYVNEWRKIVEPFDGSDAAAIAHQRAKELEDAFPTDLLEKFVANGGLKPA